MSFLRSFPWLDQRGSAGAEMALVAPLLVTIMFGSLETGKYFWDEHQLLKAVRDGARFAARQNFATMPCGGTPTNLAQIRNVVRYGKSAVTGSDRPRLFYWTDPATITVQINCYVNAGVPGARVYNGIYSARANVPIVRVTARVPYSPIVGSFGFRASGIFLNAQSEVPVFGL
jgi:Flp pilus assembly protein TadG